MGLKICSLFSGSTGNCTFITDGVTKILIDAGVHHEKIMRALSVLGQDCDNLSILVTHSHKDHMVGLRGLMKKHANIEVFAHEDTFNELVKANVPSKSLHKFAGEDFFVGGITVSAYRLSHDVPCVGYSLSLGGKKFSYITDTGIITNEARAATEGSDVVMLESNHSVELLLNGSYPYTLKRRILSERGHLSNEACAEMATFLAGTGTKYIILAHLSENNNYPELAYSVTSDALKAGGYNEVTVEVASPDRMSGLIEIL